MEQKNYIFSPTVHHTGTYFVTNITHSGFGYFSRWYNNELKPEDSEIKIKPFLTVTEHIIDFCRYKRPFICQRVRAMTIQKIQYIYDLLNKDDGCLMVVPMRDILAAMISAKRREPSASISFVVDALILVIQEFEKFEPFYFPIDLYTNSKDREDLLTELEGKIGKKMGTIDGMNKREFAETWIPRNEGTLFCNKFLGQPNLELKEAYEQKNLSYIISALNEDYDYFMEKREIIQLFFEKLGYKDLLWFEEEGKW